MTLDNENQACTSLLDGKIVILVENSPFVIILPAVLSDFFKSLFNLFHATIEEQKIIITKSPQVLMQKIIHL